VIEAGALPGWAAGKVLNRSESAEGGPSGGQDLADPAAGHSLV